MSLDILLYAALALLILWRLWVVLGRRHDDDRTRPNPFDLPPALDPARLKPAAATPSDVPVLPPILTHAPASLDGGLAQVKTLDPAFEEKAFLRQAKTDFTTIIEDFAKGDLSRSEGKLGAAVKCNFEAAIAARQAAGQTLDFTILRLTDCEVASVKIDGTRPVLTVRFVSQQQNTLRDADGRIVGGAAGQVEEIIDLWRFSRDTAQAGSVWQLVETLS